MPKDKLSEGAKDATTKKDQRLREIERLLDAMQLSRNKRKLIMKQLKTMERKKWVEFVQKQEIALKRTLLQKEKIIEPQAAKVSH